MTEQHFNDFMQLESGRVLNWEAVWGHFGVSLGLKGILECFWLVFQEHSFPH